MFFFLLFIFSNKYTYILIAILLFSVIFIYFSLQGIRKFCQFVVFFSQIIFFLWKIYLLNEINTKYCLHTEFPRLDFTFYNILIIIMILIFVVMVVAIATFFKFLRNFPFLSLLKSWMNEEICSMFSCLLNGWIFVFLMRIIGLYRTVKMIVLNVTCNERDDEPINRYIH